LAHLTVAIIDDAARKPSGEKGGEKPLFSARPSPYRGLWPHIDTVGFFDTLKHCIYQGSDSKGKLKRARFLLQINAGCPPARAPDIKN
jgi:hypothetical protein